MTPQDRALLVAPAYHAAAQTCVMNSSIVAGATMIIHDAWKGPEEVLKTIQEEKVTFFFGPPTMYSFMINYPDIGKYDTKSWRVALTAAAAMSVEMFNMFEEKFGFQPTEGYGLSETSPMVTCNPIDGLKKPGSIGKIIPGVEVQIVDYEDHLYAPQCFRGGRSGCAGPCNGRGNYGFCIIARRRQYGPSRDKKVLCRQVGTL
jgi:long-chain acyl-CoA synthetase